MWSLTINGTTQTLAEWRVQGVNLRRLNLAGDSLTFSAPRAGFDDPICSYGDTIILLDADGVRWFAGTSQTIPDSADPSSQFQTYLAVSPWRWLAENVFQQPWYNGTIYTSHILTVYNIGVTIKAVLDYAIAQGAPLTYLAADLTALTVWPPTNEFTEKTCSQVILEALQFAPDVCVWFNYTTATPTLRFVRRASLTAVSLRMADHDDDTMEKVSGLQITARPDLQVPSVKLNFETIEEVDGEQFLIPSVDISPGSATGREDGAFNATLTIQGRTVQNVFGELECETIDTASVAWWQKHIPTLNSSLVDIFSGPTGVTRSDRDGVLLPTVYLRELLPGLGAIAPWMLDTNGDPLEWQTEIIKATFFIETYDIDELGVPGSTPVRTEAREFSIEIVTTNAPAGVSSYSAVASIDSGDSAPVGLAAFLYNAMSELHYDGSFALAQNECDGTVNLGNTVNLYGARTAHQTMRALVQEVAFNIDAGTTQIQVGPPRHLGLTDLLALLQRFRVRRRWTNPDTQDTGEVGAGNGDLELAKATGNTNSIPGASSPSLFVVKSGTNKITIDGDLAKVTLTDNVNTITFDAINGQVLMSSITPGVGSVAIALAGTAGKAVSLRQVPVCQNGVTKSIILLGSPIF
jgi:hypothetical protein